MYTINGLNWSVCVAVPHSPMLRRSDGGYTVGMCDRTKQAIYVSNILRGAFLRKVLIHEVCHSAMMSYNISMTIEQEELFCDLIATYGDEIFEVADRVFVALNQNKISA